MVKIKYPNLFDLLLRIYWKVSICPDEISYRDIPRFNLFFKWKVWKWSQNTKEIVLLASCSKVPFSPGWPRQSVTRTSCCQFKVESERWQGNLINIFLVTLEQFFINGLWTGFGQMANFFKQNNFFEQDFCTNQTNDVTNEIVLDCSERNCWP